jgi:NAD(P)-dependent dehydrogenase (short-subunit alcohol dehydrogenase family)
MGMMDGKVCIVTGGAGSIGLATARMFVHAGARVMLVDRREESLRLAAAELGDQADCVHADVSIAAQVKRYVDDTVARWGKIDVLFSNAGNSGVIAPVTEYPEDVFDSVVAVHLRGAFLACKYAIPQMNDGGAIIITSSIMGVRSDAGVCAYTAAKHAQVGFMRSVAKEVAPRRIRVNTIHPGPVDNDFQREVEQGLSRVVKRDATEMLDELIPLHRHATPEEVARAVLFLASDQSAFTTGSLLMVDGGLSA